MLTVRLRYPEIPGDMMSETTASSGRVHLLPRGSTGRQGPASEREHRQKPASSEKAHLLPREGAPADDNRDCRESGASLGLDRASAKKRAASLWMPSPNLGVRASRRFSHVAEGAAEKAVKAMSRGPDTDRQSHVTRKSSMFIRDPSQYMGKTASLHAGN